MARNKQYYALKQRLRALHGDNCPKCFERMRWGGNGAGPYATMDAETETLLCRCCKSKVELLELVAELQEQVKRLVAENDGLEDQIKGLKAELEIPMGKL